MKVGTDPSLYDAIMRVWPKRKRGESLRNPAAKEFADMLAPHFECLHGPVKVYTKAEIEALELEIKKQRQPQ